MIAISQTHNEARLAGSRTALMTGAALPQIQLYDGIRPAAGEAPAGQLIAVAGIATAVIESGQLQITTTSAPILVQNTGTPTWARIMSADGVWWMDGDASDDPSAAALVTLATPGPYYYGGRIVIDSVVIG